jgi:hypothetical protein
VTPGGDIRTFPVAAGTEPSWIAAGPDADLWVSMNKAHRIARVLPDQPPRPATGAGTPTSPSTATVTGQVDPRGATSTVVVEYGPTASYGSTAPAGDVPAGIGPVAVTATLAGLTGNTTYHFRVKATSSGGTATGADGTFTTPPGTSGVDRDGDGISPPADCNDASPGIRPGARDIPGNKIDEDCNGRDAAYPLIGASITAFYSAFADHTRITGLTVRNAPAGSRIRLTCRGRGCPKARRIAVKKARRQVKLTKFVRGRRLRPGARLEVRVTAPATIGKLRRLTMRAGKLPRNQSLCLTPGVKRPRRC